MHLSNSGFFPTVLCTLLFLGFSSATAQQQSTSPEDLSLGSINFPTSASGKAQQEFLTGVLALHSFWYPEARTHFQRARELAPHFAMAYWGEAMTHDHPIWKQHNQEAGLKVLQQLDREIKNEDIKWSGRKQAYIEAIRILYNNELSMDERRKKYAQAMKQLYKQYPSDETLAFAALASITVPSHNYSNPDVRDVVPIASKLEQLYQRNPEHPGGMHYLIHLYDNEKFAELGLRPAHDYANVAYSSSHAIHMPSHIYKQLEMWDRVIKSNISAWQASVDWQTKTDRPLKNRDFHSYRWLFEAYLEVANFDKACNIINNTRSMMGKAKDKNQDVGRMPELLENFVDQYNNSAGEGVPACSSQ